jgi:TonB-dependent receptor
MRTKLLLSCALALAALPLYGDAVVHAQGAARIVGRVFDAQSGQPISAAAVEVLGTRTGTLTGVDGRYVLARVQSGPTTLRVSSIGFAAKTVTDVTVPESGVVEQDVTLESAAVQVAALEVTASAERGTVNRALDQQRTATGIVNAVTAEQISRSPDRDAAEAVQRVAGVTLMDNKFVQVRGLGERYTTTSLNGARIPSPEPEKKLVPLDLFPSGLLETITTSKTFTPDQSGDFSGASVDIKTREFPAERQQALSSSFGWNSQASGRSVFAAPTTGSEWLGFAASDRALPARIRAAGNFHNSPSQTEINTFVNAFRNAWSANSATSRPNTSLGYTVGGNGPIMGQRVGYVLSGTYSYGNEVRVNEVRARAQQQPDGTTAETDRYEGSTGRTSVLWGGVLNASTLIGSSSRIGINSTYNRSAENEAREEVGESENYGGTPLQVTRLRYVERSVGSLQLMGEHEVGDRNHLKWALTGSGVTRNEPDRSEVVYALESDPTTGVQLPPAWLASSEEGAVRTFGALSENAFEANFHYRLALGASRSNYFRVGGLFRNTERASDNHVYSITAPLIDRASRQLRPEEIFDSRFAMPGMSVFRILPLSQGGSYSADDNVYAGFAMIDWGLSERVRLVTGARIERSEVNVIAEPTIGEAVNAKPTYTDVLPALTLNVSLADNQNLRFSVSQTLSRPEYRELARLQYRDVIGGDNVVGNPDLTRTLVRNLDLRWELYPSSGEVLSVAFFGKLFKDPIERIYLGTSGTRIVTFLNAEGANNYGVELEARKRLGFLGERAEALTAFVNTTVMKSEIEIGDAASGASKISDQRAMVGQSPYVVNAGLTYAPLTSSMSATVLYNVVGKRIMSAAERPLPDVYEQPRHSLDIGLRFPILSRLSAKLDVRNVFDAAYEVTQGSALREYYKTGRIASIGLNWRP